MNRNTMILKIIVVLLLFQGDLLMLIWEIEILEETIISVFLMFFTVAFVLLLIRIKDFIAGKTTIPRREGINPALNNMI